MADFYSVAQINNYIKSIFSHDYVLNRVCIKGEVSNCKYQSNSGHIYFTLKDESAQLACVMFASKRASGLDFKMMDGMSVKAYGQISVYERDGRYQLYCERIEEDGVGNLYEQFEKLKAKLNAKGLFDKEHKKTIPPYVMKLGVITAKGGAAIQDIINISTRRNPHISICLYPAVVQGAESAASLIKGIHAMEAINPDCIIIGRGGGSIEDLWSFNDERLAQAVYDCPIPIISAVGHETDFTIIDFVSDLRAPTPSAGAELAVFDYSLFESYLVDAHSRILSNVLDKQEQYKKQIEGYLKRLKVSSPRGKLDIYKKRIADLSAASKRIMHTELDMSKSVLKSMQDTPKRVMVQRINDVRFRLATVQEKPSQIMKNKLDQKKAKLLLNIEKLNVVSPLKKLEAGYSYVTDENGKNVDSVTKVKSGDAVNIRMKDGNVGAVIR